MVSNIHLHNTAYQEMKRQLPSIGTLRRLLGTAGNRGPYRFDTPPLWDWAPHDLSMCLDIIGQAPDMVASRHLAKAWINNGYGGNHRLSLGFWDVTAEITLGNMMETKIRRFEVVGSQGSLVLDDVAGTLVSVQNSTETIIPFPPAKPLARQLLAFAAAVRQGRASDPSLSLGCTIVDIIAQCDLEQLSN